MLTLVQAWVKRRRRLAAAVLIVLLEAIGASPAFAQMNLPLEAQLKAGFLYYFAVFADWPAAHQTALTVCVLGRDPFDGQLDRLIGNKSISTRKVLVAIVGKPTEIALLQCDVAFVSRSERQRVADMLAWTRKRPILTISDIPQFARSGGIIGLSNEGQRMRFEVNRVAAEQAGLKLSAKLLSLATLVYTDSGSGPPAVP